MKRPQASASSRLLLLGESEGRYGEYRLERLPSGQTACSLSVGSDVRSPALAHKGNPGVPNEDALLVVEEGPRALLAVADAHHGSFASHALLRRLEASIKDLPPSPAALVTLLRTLGVQESGPRPRSESTLLLALLRRDLRAGFGFCYGDSSCAVVGPGQSGASLCEANPNYVSPAAPASLAPERASFFEFDLPPGALLLVFSDGINNCHYRRPRTSLGPDEYQALFEQVGPDVKAYAQGLTEAALKGRPGYPGGQDNLALIVAR